MTPTPKVEESVDSAKASNDLQGGLKVRSAFVKALPPGQTKAAAYLAIENLSDRTKLLNYVHSPIAENVEVHRTIYEQGMMQMRHVKHLSVNPGQKLVFEPGGYHLMLFGISKDLVVGEQFPLTMEFGSDVIEVQVEVKPHG